MMIPFQPLKILKMGLTPQNMPQPSNFPLSSSKSMVASSNK